MQLLADRLRLYQRACRQDGQALVLVVFLIAALTLFLPILMDAVSSSATRSNEALIQSHAHAAAEAGINDYIAKLLDDNQYYLQYMAPGEATRKSTTTPYQTISSVPAPSSPTSVPGGFGTGWTFPNGKDAWVDLGNGYSYDLEITSPQTQGNNTNYLQIVSTGKAHTGGTSADRQVIQVLIRPASVADFQMLSAVTVCYGTDATTNGYVYSLQDVDFGGTANANVYAEGRVNLSSSCGSGRINSPAQKYDTTTNPGIRSVIKQPVQFGDFQVSLVDIKRASELPGSIYLSNSSAYAWQLTFNSNGTVTYASCKNPGGRNPQPIQNTRPTCDGSIANLNTSLNGGAGSGTISVPTNGAIYADQSVIIGPGSSTCRSALNVTLTNADCVMGRVSVASGADIVVGDDIGYVTPGTDVLGLMAQNNVWVADWTGNSLNWSAATLAENGYWSEPRSGVSNNSHSGTMTFSGSTATALGGAMSMFANRSYNYDPHLTFLQPPWFPTLQSAYTILVYRDLPNSS